MKQLRISVPGHGDFLADFLWEDAPKTCKAVCEDLPYSDATLSHVKWSGCVIGVFTNMLFREAENSRGLSVWPGDILYNPHLHDKPEHPNEISIVYGEAAMRTFSGYAIANLFARVRPEYLETLNKLGNDINLHGWQTASITVEDIPEQE